MVMINPWRPLAFYFQSPLNSTVNYIPVLATPRDFVKEILWKSSEGFPVPFVHCYGAITIVIPDSSGNISTATTMQEDDLRSVNCPSFGTVLKWKRNQLICESEGTIGNGEYQVHPDFEFLKAFLVTNENQAFQDNRSGYSRSQCLRFWLGSGYAQKSSGVEIVGGRRCLCCFFNLVYWPTQLTSLGHKII